MSILAQVTMNKATRYIANEGGMTIAFGGSLGGISNVDPTRT
jgi:hypothetical protein